MGRPSDSGYSIVRERGIAVISEPPAAAGGLRRVRVRGEAVLFGRSLASEGDAQPRRAELQAALAALMPTAAIGAPTVESQSHRTDQALGPRVPSPRPSERSEESRRGTARSATPAAIPDFPPPDSSLRSEGR